MKYLAVALVAASLVAIVPLCTALAQTAKADTASKKQTKQLVNGYRRYHAGCNHCHGPDGLGSSFGPSLVDSPPDPDKFRKSVREGVSGPRGKMKGFGNDPNVMDHLDDILAYIDARSRGEIGRGRPR